MSKGRKNLGWIILAVFGFIVILAEIALHFISWYSGRTYEMNHFVLTTGAILGFWGCFMLNPTSTKEGIKILTNLAPRFGRRASDAIAIPHAETKITAEPVAPEVK